MTTKKDDDGAGGNPWRKKKVGTQQEDDQEGSKLWALVLFGLAGATATTIAAGQLRRTIDWVYSQLSRSRSYFSGRGSSGHSSFKEEAWKKYYRRMQEEHEDEMERLERIKRMQNVFNRNKRKTYETWTEYGPGQYHQHFQREDWYWKTDSSSHRDTNANSNFRRAPETGKYVLSHHYFVLGLQRFRSAPYTDDEIKTAFRTKAKEFHPDQNQGNEEAAEAKFKEVMTSYEAIKLERKNGKS